MYHLTIASRGRLTLFSDEATLRRGVRGIVRTAADHVVLFSLVDDHLHIVASGTRAQAGGLSRRVGVSLSRLTRIALAPAHYEPVESRKHLSQLVRYLLIQPQRHGLRTHPGLYSGSCFLDLLGARTVGFEPRVFALLPRIRRGELLDAVGLPSSLQPFDLSAVYDLGISRLAGAARAAFAVIGNRKLDGPPLRAAEVTAAQIGQAAGFTTRALASALGISAATVLRRGVGWREYAGNGTPLPISWRTVLTRLALEETVAAHETAPSAV